MAARRRGTVGACISMLVLAVRFVSGAPMDGRHRTDATMWQSPTKPLDARAHRSWWHWRPGWHRGLMRVAVVAVVAALAYGMLTTPRLTVAAVAGLLFSLACWTAWRLWLGVRSWVRAARTRNIEHPPANRWAAAAVYATLPYQHYVFYVRPLRAALTQELNVPPARVKVPFDRSGAVVYVPHQYGGADKSREGIIRVVTAKLALEQPEPSWQLHGRKPRVAFIPTQPPPRQLAWRDIEAVVRAAKPHELVCGIGKKGAAVKVSTQLDSPHFGISMGSGGGKSNLAAFWLVQRLMLGDLALILDAKWFSHPWAFKNMRAEYDQLPNVAYARTTAQLHAAMIWLGVELQRRTEVADRKVNSKGDIRGGVGPKLWILAEEMNLATPRLKQHWARLLAGDRDLPKRSPAFDGMAAVSFAGRALDMHLVPIGQMMTAAILGGGDVRENIGVGAMARYTENSWNLQYKGIPMPPPSDIPGRVQIIASATVRETQVPLMDLDYVRELAVSGIVRKCAEHMPRLPAGLAVPVDGSPSVPAIESSSPQAPDQAIVLDKGRPPDTLTISEATREGLFVSLDAARKAVQRRGLEPAGKDGNAHLYRIGDLATIARRIS